ncbi:D-sedoheptulose 7-phosphate isomerase [Caldicoprobacter guelmensis]|uniref:D-sedoheptulose-7-phosphate isomerase n=1 Tax=Caldicoprobacter guelmensis TaxID=1170224 RepID=UPI001FAF8EC4|nr:SIS domain-containing protein [Caldicoprobacter guelmensis]MBM7581521.1 D-sedoheptulose 7-phosphate isomerase [Caldicoprobacter guelmensis]
MGNPMNIFQELMDRYPALKECREDILRAYEILVECYQKGNKVLIAGNGGSAADAEHIVGELMKGFMKKRVLPDTTKQLLLNKNTSLGSILAEKLQGALPAIALTSQSSIFTAFVNDVDPDLVFAQQVLGYGRPGDVFIGLTTSGNSPNILYAAYLAGVLGLKTIGFTGKSGGRLKDLCDVTIRVPADSTPKVQELHLPVYHALCAMVEEHFF